MKIALCLFGQPRFFEQTHKYFFSNLIEALGADVYFHSWWSERMVGNLYPCALHAKDSLDDEDMLVRSDIPDKLIELYKPKDYLFEDYDIFINQFSKPNYYQYYTQWQVGQLLRHRYDLVIRSRFDLMCTQDIEIIQDNNLWVPSCCPYTDRVNDMFSISNHDNFLRISETYLNLPAFEEQGNGEMEWAFISQIKKERLHVKTFEAKYETFDVMRSKDKIRFSI